MKTLTLSIVIPAYNETHHIGLCLKSIAKQTKKPDEVIVVDNNSTDDTVKICQKYDFVKVVPEKKQGIVFARDRGFNEASSTIIGRIDADTILPRDWVERVIDFYSDDSNSDHAYTGGCYFYNSATPKFTGWVMGQIGYRMNRLLLGHYILFGSNMALPKSLWLSVKGKTCSRTDIHEDLDLAIHLHRLGYAITYRETLKVGVEARRVAYNTRELWPTLMMWPKTLRIHHRKTWPFGLAGALVLYSLGLSIRLIYTIKPSWVINPKQPVV